MFDGIIKNSLTDLLRLCMVAFASWLGLQPDSTQYNEFVAAGLTIGAGVWAWYENKGHQIIVDALKTHSGQSTIAAAVKQVAASGDDYKRFTSAVAFCIIASSALACSQSHAADVAPSPVYKAPQSAPTKPACSLTLCNMWYLFGDITGTGTNLDLLGNGVNGSINAGGSTMHGGVGGMIWNGTYELGVSVGCGYSFNVAGAQATGVSGYDCYEELEAGGNLFSVLSPSAVAPGAQRKCVLSA